MNRFGEIGSCTPCCPYDAQKLPHPQFNQSSSSATAVAAPNSDGCCLSKLQVDCRIRCLKKKKKKKRKSKQNTRHNSASLKRSISVSTDSSSSQLNEYKKRRMSGSSTNTNSHYVHHDDYYTSKSRVNTRGRLSSSSSEYDSSAKSELTTTDSSSSETSELIKSSYQQAVHNGSAKVYHDKIHDLKSSIDHLAELIVHRQNIPPRTSFSEKLRRLFGYFISPSKIDHDDSIDNQCRQILEQNQLTKSSLISIYHLFEKNDTIFLDWLRTLMPEHLLPLILNYVKHFELQQIENK